MERIIGLPVALRQEAFSIFGSRGWSKAGSFLCKVERIGGRVFWMVVTGPGMERARAGASFLLESGSCVIINLGVAGALVDRLEIGHVICPATIVNYGRKDELQHIHVDSGVKDKLDRLLLAACVRADSGILFTANQVIETKEAKASVKAETHAHAVDMEAFYLASICKEAGVPFLAIKAISDTLNQSLPSVVSRCVRPDGSLNMPLLVLGLALRPWLVPRLLEVKEGYQKAIYSLELAKSAIVANGDL